MSERDDTSDTRQVTVLAGALRAAGVPVGTGQVVVCQRATRTLGGSAVDLYWAGRTTLLNDPLQLAVYDRVFAELYATEEQLSDHPDRSSDVPPTVTAGSEPTGSCEATAETMDVGTVASELERVRHRRFDQASPEELAIISQMLQQLEVALPHRSSRRTRPGRVGELDLTRTLERSLVTDGEFLETAYRARRRRPRRLVVLLDVSGSMAPYARAMLRLGMATRRMAERDPARQVEVFAFGTRLTRLSDVFAGRDPSAAIAAAAERVVDWDGGTRIGDSINELVRVWGRRGALRGSVVVVCCDGLERGDPDLLASAVARLRRHVHRIVWVNPLAGDPRYEPTQRGMAAALPYVDVFLPGHDLASLEFLTEVLANLR